MSSSAEDDSIPATYHDHLLSQSLFAVLFRHNIVSADGRIKDDQQRFNKYRSTILRECSERTTGLYEMRKKYVDEAENLLKIRYRSRSEEKRLKELLNELDLELIDDEIVAPNEVRSPPRKYLGSSEPKLSICERKWIEENKRRKILKRDLKFLDKWLEEISKPTSKVTKLNYVPSMTWEEFQKKHHIRRKRRISEMNLARRNFIKSKNTYNDNAIRKFLTSLESVERVRIYQSKRQLPKNSIDPKESQSKNTKDQATLVKKSHSSGLTFYPEKDQKIIPASLPESPSSECASSAKDDRREDLTHRDVKSELHKGRGSNSRQKIIEKPSKSTLRESDSKTKE